jgi:acetyltransferase-like isoleucine patch superfamily enzyme
MGVCIGSNVMFYGMPIVSLAPNSKITIGDRVVLCSDSRFTALGINHPVVLRTLCSGASIYIGNDTGISGGSICSALKVEIGRECLLGADIVISDTDFHPIQSKTRRYNADKKIIKSVAVQLGVNVFLGTGSIVLKGVTIADHCVVGAHAVVTKSIDSLNIVAGNPAVIVGKIIS